MYRQSMANGAAASCLFFLFLFFLARHMRKLKISKPEDEQLRQVECGTLPPPPYFVVPSQPPPSYQEALKMGCDSLSTYFSKNDPCPIPHCAHQQTI